ncbi:hypothetical protein WA026_006201 [Henosepilachna vigintioctopunctata]|uniref:Uncharacterized protein n=1 Tax=Henosepilachna vigintioctopunctata TaxID=420089 RepID=A0AAW1TQQ1_9CUCU
MKESDLHCLSAVKTDVNSLELDNLNGNVKMFENGDSLISCEPNSTSNEGFCSRRFSEEYLVPSDASESI